MAGGKVVIEVHFDGERVGVRVPSARLDGATAGAQGSVCGTAEAVAQALAVIVRDLFVSARCPAALADFDRGRAWGRARAADGFAAATIRAALEQLPGTEG